MLLAALWLGAVAPAAAQQRPNRNPPRPPPAAPPAAPAITAQPLVPLPPLPMASPITAVPPEPLQRRIALPELGLTAGFTFDATGQDLFFPLPRGINGLAARVELAVDLVAPFPGRFAVELRANGRLITSRGFAPGETTIVVEAPIPGDDLAREADALRVNLRLVDLGGSGSGARATVRAESYATLLVPEDAVPSVAALFRLLPLQTQVLMRPGAIPPAEAAAALRIGLALAGTGRDVEITSGSPPVEVRAPDGGRLWTTGAVAVGVGEQGAAVIEIAGLPTLALGGTEPERAARLLDSPWRGAAAVPAVAVAEARAPASTARLLPFSALRGSTAPQQAAQASWSLDFSTRDLPRGTRPEALEVEIRAAPDPAGGRAVATLLLNEVMLGAATLSADGHARLALPIPERLVGIDNRIGVVLHRASASGPAQLMPDSAIRLGPATAAREFLALPPTYAEGVEVIIDAPGGELTAQALNPVLWALRAVIPPAAPLSVTLVEPGTAPQPRGPFVAVTREAPAGTTPALRFDAGRIALSDREGRPLLALDGVQRVIAAQLIPAGPGATPGLWVRLPTLMGPLPAAAPRLDRGDIALLDRQGVALAWSSRDSAPLVRANYPDAPATTSIVLIWRPYVVGVLWLAGVALVGYAFARPRRDRRRG